MGTAVIGAPAFRARSGRTVRAHDDGSVSFEGGNGYIGRAQVFDAEEFFQAKKDADLGRSRSPVDPHLVVYPDRTPVTGARMVRVLDERHGTVTAHYDSDTDRPGEKNAAARAYFEAHPEVEHDAERAALIQAIQDALGVTPETIAAGHQRPGNSEDLADALIAAGYHRDTAGDAS